jgi:hypothetical protein
MTHRLSPAQFMDNIDRFKEGHASFEPWNTPEGAVGQCYGASCDYVAGFPEGHAHAGEHTSVASFTGYRGDPSRAVVIQGKPVNMKGHYVAVTETTEGPQVVDWTARQFDSSADFPHVRSLEEYSQLWDKVDHSVPVREQELSD